MRTDSDNDKLEEDIRNRVDMIFENYTLEEVLEMNDLTPEDVIFLLFMEGQISEPEAYLP